MPKCKGSQHKYIQYILNPSLLRVEDLKDLIEGFNEIEKEN